MGWGLDGEINSPQKIFDFFLLEVAYMPMHVLCANHNACNNSRMLSSQNEQILALGTPAPPHPRNHGRYAYSKNRQKQQRMGAGRMKTKTTDYLPETETEISVIVVLNLSRLTVSLLVLQFHFIAVCEHCV